MAVNTEKTNVEARDFQLNYRQGQPGGLRFFQYENVKST